MTQWRVVAVVGLVSFLVVGCLVGSVALVFGCTSEVVGEAEVRWRVRWRVRW